MPRKPRTVSIEDRSWVPCAQPGCPLAFDPRGFQAGVGRPRLYCSDACKIASYRERRARG